MILRLLGLAMIAAPLATHGAFAQEASGSALAPEVSATPVARPDPEDRGSEDAPDAAAEEPAGEVSDEAAGDEQEETDARTGEDEEEAPEEAPDAPPLWQTLREAPEDYAACLDDLREFGAVFEERDALPGVENPNCGIAKPIEVTQILPGVELRPDAVMRCDTARALASWASGTVVPAAERTGVLSPLAAINHGSTYVCRNRGGVASDKVSEHGFGNAVDVMGFQFEDDTTLVVEPRAESGTIEEAFQRAARGGACLDFTTVLGPGSDEAHADHLHLDVKQRDGGYRICQ